VGFGRVGQKPVSRMTTALTAEPEGAAASNALRGRVRAYHQLGFFSGG
jgi:hypothetical protein